MKTYFLSNKATQATIRNLRNAGWTVNKSDAGRYEIKEGTTVLFVALKGSNNYMVRIDERLLAEQY